MTGAGTGIGHIGAVGCGLMGSGIAPSSCIPAANTSSISITRVAAATRRPEWVLGPHFFTPVPVTKLVEALRGVATNREVFDRAMVHGCGHPIGRH
jgi:3-hydroxyacyl-CoA dehydrogenase